MQQAKRGDTVHVHYRGILTDGTEFDSSAGGEPLVFTIGEGEVIAGFENAVEGMSTGEKKTEQIPVVDAYGVRREELVFTVGREEMQGNDVEVGDMFQVGFPDGSAATVQVVALTDATVTLDANHPLAGKDLTFELELVAID